MSSFSNPLGTIDRATGHGYKVADFALTTMRFGAYSSEPKVRAQIERLANQRPRMAFIGENGYCLAAVLWSRTADVDLTRGLQAAITSLHP